MEKKESVGLVPETVEDVEIVKTRAQGDLVDSEVAKYASDAPVDIDELTNKRLKRLIDMRVLSVMVVTYLIQALDKGTMSVSRSLVTDEALPQGS